MVTSIVGIFHAACGEAPGFVASLPYFQTLLVTTQMATLTIAPPTTGLITIPALNLHACSLDVAFCLVATFERLVAAGTVVFAALLLHRPPSSTLRFDQDAAYCGRTGKRRECGGGGVGRTVIDVVIRKRRVAIRLRGTRERVGAVRARVGFESIRAEEAIGWTYLWLLPSSGTGSGCTTKSAT